MLTRLIARDFRNFVQLDVAVPQEGFVVVGDNGHGKTNLLEAVAYLTLLRSSRGARDADCIRFGAPAFHIRAETTPPSAWQRIALGYERSTKRKRATLDGVEQTRLSRALGALPSVGFSPADVSLVSGGPGERRRYLDVVLSLSSPTYLAELQQYRAALARRNAELRTAQRDLARSARHADRVAVWEPLLARHGGAIAAMRADFVQRYAARFAELAVAIGEPQPMAMRYQTSIESSTEDGLLAALAQQRGQEMRRGMTACGPHRDELQLTIGQRDVRVFASAGQQRSAAIALRLIELETVRMAIGTAPLLLLDDPFAELDAHRASRVLALLEHEQVAQVLLAVPRVEDVPEAFTRLERRTMHGGVLS